MKRRPGRSAQVKGRPGPQGERATDASSRVVATPVAAAQREGDHEEDVRTRKALRSLPAHLRKILLLREIERLPMDEVAARLGLSRAAARRRWARAIEVMAERLAKIPPGKDKA